MNELPKSQELVQPVIEILKDARKPLNNKEIEKAICELLQLSASSTRVIHNGNRTELQYRLAWAKTKAKNLGKIENVKREVWQLREK